MISDKTIPIFGLSINPPYEPDRFVECENCGQVENQTVIPIDHQIDDSGQCWLCRRVEEND